MAKFNRKICENCRVVFSSEIEEQNKCYRCLTELKERKLKDQYELMRKEYFGTDIIRIQCPVCLNFFNKSRYKNKITCSTICHQNYMKENSNLTKIKSSKKENEIKKANEKWLNNENKKSGRKIPLKVLDKIHERKRIWDDKGWSHYLKGRKWDRI